MSKKQQKNPEMSNYTTIPQYGFWKNCLIFTKAACIWLKTQNGSNIVKYYYNVTVFC